MKALITGCGGFIGSHLADLLIEKGHDVYGTTFSFDGMKNIEHIKDRIHVLECDMEQKEQVENIVKQVRPDIVFHLAAQSFVVPSWKDPEKTMKINVLGTLYIFEALRKFSPDAVTLVACSSAEYGSVSENEVPINEQAEFRPSSPYAVSKVGQDMLSYLYHKAYGMKIIRMRIFNTTGPRKTFDACSDFSKGIAEIEAKKKSSLQVGNLEGLRDITDARDSVRAMYLLYEKGKHGEVYNICTGRTHKMKDILDKLVSMSSSDIEIIASPDSERKIDDPLFLGDNSKLSDLGWKPEISIEKSLSDMIEYWRKEMQNN